ncbi:hypothetical protein [Bradyrhizobium sp. 33ap4]|uniref:hypothetical protein n=1 Tax=Bradyrhizobium sp. 33ap4 TaxID=3061630 RepID=UPI002930A630|nr:hypothetical protein [Bradyrhizobium sp. 33ap4]
MGYGVKELIYAEPFANALVDDPTFRSWALSRTMFSAFSDARLMHQEMQNKRSARYWWRSHFTEACRCEGCSGQETDLLAIFEATTGFRFAVHIEVKHPGDNFKHGGRQAASYNVRAQCWAAKAPQKVVRHDMAASALLCSEIKLAEYAKHVAHFGTVFTFEEIKRKFPDAVPRP